MIWILMMKKILMKFNKKSKNYLLKKKKIIKILNMNFYNRKKILIKMHRKMFNIKLIKKVNNTINIGNNL